MSWFSKATKNVFRDPSSSNPLGIAINYALQGTGNKTMLGSTTEHWYGKDGKDKVTAPVVPERESAESSEANSAATIQKILEQYLAYNPQVAGQQYDLTAKYLPQYAALNRGMVSQERTAGIDDAARLAPRLQGIREASDRSDIRSMRDQLYAAVLGDLSMGERLTPEQDRNAVQSVRSAQSARGLNGGQSGANIEAIRRALSGQALGTQRRAAASGVLAQEASQKPDPFSIILGMPTTATTAAFNQTAAGNNALSPSMLSSAFFGATQANQAANQYNLSLELAKQNPYLYKS